MVGSAGTRGETDSTARRAARRCQILLCSRQLDAPIESPAHGMHRSPENQGCRGHTRQPQKKGIAMLLPRTEHAGSDEGDNSKHDRKYRVIANVHPGSGFLTKSCLNGPQFAKKPRLNRTEHGGEDSVGDGEVAEPGALEKAHDWERSKVGVGAGAVVCFAEGVTGAFGRGENGAKLETTCMEDVVSIPVCRVRALGEGQRYPGATFCP